MNSKTYIFVAETIYGLGGSQRYILDKSKWLNDQGWNVHFVFSSLGEEVLDFSCVTAHHFPLLMCRPAIVPKRTVTNLIDELKANLNKGSFVVVESSSYDYAFWGELIAKELKAKHLIFDLDEVPPRLSKDEIEFFRFKLERGELACITTSCLRRVFPEMTEQELSQYILVAYMGDAVEDIPFDTTSLPEADFRIGLVSRLDKNFVSNVFDEVARFSRDFPELRISFLIVGDTNNEALLHSLFSSVENIDNLDVIRYGFMAPIPRNLIKSFDLAVAKSGCAWACARNGIPTAVYSMDTDEAMGILGIDFDHSPARSDGEPKNLCAIIQSVLIDRLCDGKDIVSMLPSEEVKFDKHFNFLNASVKTESYWEVKKIKTTVLRLFTSLATLVCGKYPLEMVSNVKRVLRFV